MNTHRRTTSARRTLLSLAGVSLTAVAIGLTGTSVAARCTVLDQPPGQMIAQVAPFDGQINPGNPNGLDEPMIAALCRSDRP